MRKTVSDYPKLFAQWHPIKNGDLLPEALSYGSNRKVWWQCPVSEDHEWEARISNRVFNDAGCPCCSGKKVVATNSLAAMRPDVATQWNYEKNGDLTPEMVTVNSGKKVWWKCPVSEDHQWEARIINRVNGTGCLCCINQKVVASNCLTTTHPRIASEWHPTKNGSLKPSDICAGSNKKIWWKCAGGHEWIATTFHRTNGKMPTDCPVCNESKGEKKIAEYLNKKNIKFKRQWKFSSCRNVLPLPFDFVIWHNRKIKIIEYQGKQHYYSTCTFGNKMDPESTFREIKKRDGIKRKWCEDKHIPFLPISYKNYEDIEIFLEKFTGE